MYIISRGFQGEATVFYHQRTSQSGKKSQVHWEGEKAFTCLHLRKQEYIHICECYKCGIVGKSVGGALLPLSTRLFATRIFIPPL